MATIDMKYNIHCHNDCSMGGCHGHQIELTFQTTGDVFIYKKDGEYKFGMDTTEMNELLAQLKSLSKRRNEINY